MKISNRTSTVYSSVRTPEQEKIDRQEHQAIEALPSPISPESGSIKQVAWANSIFRGERFYWFAQEYLIDDLKLFLSSPEARSCEWWINNRPPMKGDGHCRLAMDKVIASIKRCREMAKRF